MKKLFLSLIASVILFSPQILAYEDIDYNSDFYYGIEYLRINDIVPETKTFKPKSLVSKAEFIKYLVLLNSPDFQETRTAALPYEDTRDTAWYASYFEEAIKLGILDGRDTKAYPDKKLTVIEGIELLFHSKSIPIPRKYTGSVPFKDVDRNHIYKALTMRAYDLGIADPERSDYFGIYKRLTRERAAGMIYKMDLVNLKSNESDVPLTNIEPGLQKIITAYDLLTNNYLRKDSISNDEIVDAAIGSMTELLDDPYSAYLDKEANKSFNDEIDGKFEGIGAYIALDDNEEILIISPIKNTPAEKAGLKAGDVIVKIDGIGTKGLGIYKGVNLIKGPKGSTVKLTVRRNNKLRIFNVIRDVVNIDPLDYEVVGNNNIMHIKLYNFNQNAADEFRDVIEVISNDPGIEGVIIDVRDNPGGLLDVAIAMLSYLLPDDSPVVTIKYSFFSYTQNVTRDGELKDMPIIVLINKGSASASEIIAGAMKENHKNVKLIGETSFGKGTVQEVNYFYDNSSLKLTVAEWLTPNSKSIEGNGIKPDIEVKNPAEDEGDTDPQLDRAIIELNKMIK